MRHRIIGFHLLGGAVIAAATAGPGAGIGAVIAEPIAAIVGALIGLVCGLISAALAPRRSREVGFWLVARLLAPSLIVLPTIATLVLGKTPVFWAVFVTAAVMLVTAITGWAAIPYCLEQTGPKVARRAFLGLCLPGAIAILGPLLITAPQ